MSAMMRGALLSLWGNILRVDDSVVIWENLQEALMMRNTVIYSFFLLVLWFSDWAIHMEVIMHRGRFFWKKDQELDLLVQFPDIPKHLTPPHNPARLPSCPSIFRKASQYLAVQLPKAYWFDPYKTMCQMLCSLNLSRWQGLSSTDMVYGRHCQLEDRVPDVDPANYFTRLNWALEKYWSRADQCIKNICCSTTHISKH